ncbi:MAG: toprim domain-containing protein, partial [Cyanobacteria bacterium J06649_11]
FLGGKWIWKDFGDEGGNVIDFVMRYQNVDFKNALVFLRNMYQGSLFGTPQKTSTNQALPYKQQVTSTIREELDRELEFLDAYPIKRQIIFDYLRNLRGIPNIIARQYLHEVTYINKRSGKIFFAFGMANESNGYEIRSASDRYKFQSALIKRDISLISGRVGGSKTVCVFEGITDFLSLLVLEQLPQLEQDAIVMHSVSTYQRTLEVIQEQNYETVYTYLDNDKAGNKYTDKFCTDLSKVDVLPQNQSFVQHKDLNEKLVASRQSPLPGLSL